MSNKQFNIEGNRGSFDLESMMSSTPSCVKIIRRDGSLVHMNKQGLSLIEADNLESVLGANVYDLVEESHLENFKILNERVCTGETRHLVFEIIGLKGTRRWMETYAAPYALADNEIAHIAITNDITAQKNEYDIRNLISELRQQYITKKGDSKTFFDFLLSKVIEITKSEYGFIGEIKEDTSGQYLQTYAITDISWNEETNHFYKENAPGGLEFRNLQTLFGEVIKTGEPMITNAPQNHPKAFGIPAGHPSLNAFMGVPLYNSGKLIAMMGVANRKDGYNIQFYNSLVTLFETIAEMIAYYQLESENRLKEKELNNINSYLELALEGANLGIWDWYLDDNSVNFDRRWAEMLGLDYQTIEMNLKTWESRVHPDDLGTCYEDIKAYMTGKTDQYKNIHRMKHANGEWIYILDQGKFSAWDEDGRPTRFTGTHLDVTEQKRQENEIIVARNKALSAEKAKAQFLANMSHEIRTPMNGVLGMVALLSETKLTQTQREMLETIKSCGDTLMELLNNILDISKIDAGKLKIEKTTFDLIKLFSDTINLLGIKANEKNLDIFFENNIENESLYIGDPTRIKQIVVNLISNATKFTESGNITIRVEDLNISDQNWVHFSVEDTGIGIEEKVREELFEDFIQADGSTTRKYGGSGLGLSICRQLVTLMGGTIELQSTLGKGSKFSIVLPLEKISYATNKDFKNQDLHNSTAGGSFRILVVEDNAVNQKVAQLILESLGHVPQIAEDGRKAIELVKQNGIDFYDIILMDMQMPEMDGIETARTLNDEYGTRIPPIIALTANAFADDAKKCFDAGMSGFIAKPINKSKIKEYLNSEYINSVKGKKIT